MTTQILDRPDSTGQATAGEAQVLVTLTVADQLCGVPVLAVRDILGEQAITRIPLAPPEMAGLCHAVLPLPMIALRLLAMLKGARA